MENKQVIQSIKETIAASISGKFMVRKVAGKRVHEARGIYEYRVYFDTPTSNNKELIQKTIRDAGCTPHGFQIIGGTYGYIIGFRVVAKSEEGLPYES